MSAPDLVRVRHYVLRRLANELASELSYHCLEHTRDDVVPAARRLAAAQGLPSEDTVLLTTGALFHDLGFVVQADGHEAIGAGIAREVLPGFGYTPEQVDIAVGIIMATAMPQSPRTLLERLMADADLDVLGRTDFMAKNAALRAELAALGQPTTRAQWYTQQQRFVAEHEYFTDVARALRDDGKRDNLAEMRRIAESLTDSIDP